MSANNERIRMSLRELMSEDLKNFKRNIFSLNIESQFYQNMLVKLYSLTLKYSNVPTFLKEMTKRGKTKNDSYLDFFTNNELRKIGYALYEFNNTFNKMNNPQYYLTPEMAESILYNATHIASKKDFTSINTSKTNLKPIIKNFDRYVKYSGFELLGNVLSPKANKEKQKEFNALIDKYNDSLIDFKSSLSKIPKDYQYLILQTLNQSFYCSTYGQKASLEPAFYINKNQANVISPTVLKNHILKYQAFKTELDFRKTYDSFNDLIDIAEEAGTFARDRVKCLSGDYPEFSLDFTNQILLDKYDNDTEIIYNNNNQTM